MLEMQPDLRLAVPGMVAGTAAITILLAAALFYGERKRISWSPATIIWVAVAARLLFLFRPPELSDDIYRYLWDGLNLLSGRNPYAAPPAGIQPVPEALAGLQRLVNHPDLVTIYPPAAQVVFAAGALSGGGVIGVKALLVLLDLGSCLLILRLLAAFRLPAWRAALYAWHPLPVLEVGASGHIDAAGIFFVLATLCLLAGSPGASREKGPAEVRHASPWGRLPREFIAGATFAFALLVKFFPLVFLPGYVLAIRRKRLPFLTGTALGGLALTVPFLPDLRRAAGTLKTYAENWEFAGFAFRSLRHATGSGETARMVLAVLFTAAVACLYARLFMAYRKTTPKGEGNLLPETVRVFSAVVFCFLLLTPTLHPWYTLYLAAFLPFAAGPAGLVLSWSVLLGYRVLIPYTILGRWTEDDVTPALITLAPLGAFFACAVFRRLKALPR